MIFKLQNVQVNYTTDKVTTPALRGVNLEIENGISLSIMGKSGSGKTTLLNVLGGLLCPTAGSVLYDGEELYDRNDNELCLYRLRNVGFVYQAYDLLPELTAYENIVLPLLLDGKDIKTGLDGENPVQKDVEALCEKMGIEKLLKRFPFEMSGGEQQRVAIARALVHKPKLLLCDEPTGNLDEATSGVIMDTILSLHKELETTVIIVTHDKDVAARCEKQIRIHDGLVEEQA